MNEEQRKQFYLLNEEYYYWEPDTTEESSLEFYKRMAHSFQGMLLELYEAEEEEQC